MVITKHTLVNLALNIFQMKLKNFIGNKNIATNIYRIQANDLTMCGYLCNGFIDFRVKDC